MSQLYAISSAGLARPVFTSLVPPANQSRSEGKNYAIVCVKHPGNLPLQNRLRHMCVQFAQRLEFLHQCPFSRIKTFPSCDAFVDFFAKHIITLVFPAFQNIRFTRGVFVGKDF